MMKKNLLGMVVLLLLAAPAVHAALAYLPDSAYVDGRSHFNTGTVSGFIEYAVYDTSIQPMNDYDGPRFIYAYQVFQTAGNAIEAISIFGFDPLAIQEDSLDVSDELYGQFTAGKDAVANLIDIDPSDVKARYDFTDGAVLTNETSLFLLMFSDYDYVMGSYEINPSDSDVTVPGKDTDATGDNNSTIPEPATLALLAIGGLLSRRRKP